MSAKSTKNRKLVAPPRTERNWVNIGMYTAAGVVALAIVGGVGWYTWDAGRSGTEKAAGISGIQDFRKKNSKIEKIDGGFRGHVKGKQKYETTPAAYGNHNGTWQNCMGDVYDAPIAAEHAVHSLEHGAVWVTYRPDLPKDQIEKLASKVRGQEFLMLSPFKDQDKPISLQAWGFQLKVDNAGDKRIDDFINYLKKDASVEPGAACSGGVTEPGDEPRELAPPQQPGQPGAPG